MNDDLGGINLQAGAAVVCANWLATLGKSRWLGKWYLGIAADKNSFGDGRSWLLILEEFLRLSMETKQMTDDYIYIFLYDYIVFLNEILDKW